MPMTAHAARSILLIGGESSIASGIDERYYFLSIAERSSARLAMYAFTLAYLLSHRRKRFMPTAMKQYIIAAEDDDDCAMKAPASRISPHTAQPRHRMTLTSCLPFNRDIFSAGVRARTLLGDEIGVIVLYGIVKWQKRNDERAALHRMRRGRAHTSHDDAFAQTCHFANDKPKPVRRR